MDDPIDTGPDEARAKVLYVDDEDTNLAIFRSVFEPPHVILTAKSGAEALALLEAHDIAVCIADQRMPSITGNDLLEISRERWPDTVRVILTAFSELAPALDAVKRGQVFRYVIKPWTTAEMAAILDGAIEIHRMAIERRRMHDSLIASERMATMGILAGNIGHEMTNALSHPWNALQIADGLSRPYLDLAAKCDQHRLLGSLPPELNGFMESLDFEKQTREFKEWWGLLRETLSQAVDLARSLVDAVKPPELKLRAVDTGRLVHVVGRLAKDFLVRHRAEIVVLPGDVPPLRGDPVSLRQILLNLLINAAQATPPGTPKAQVVLRTVFDEDWVYIEVIDKGVGIPPENLDRIFRPLFTTKPGGTGLGLSISRDLARRMDGDIGVATEPGKGSTFTVKLPVYRI